MEHQPSRAYRQQITAAAMVLLVLLLLLWYLLKPAAATEVSLQQRRAQLAEAVRQRDTIPTPPPVIIPREPVDPVPVAAVAVPPPAVMEPVRQEQPPKVQDQYMENVQRYLRNLELRHYDDLARRKENFEQKMRAENDLLSRQWEQLANFKAPRPKVILSNEARSRMWYCKRCHIPRSPEEMAEFFARAGEFH